MAGTGGSIDVHVESAEWLGLRARIGGFAPRLLSSLRKNIRVAADEAANAVKAKLAEPTPEGTPLGPGREALIAGTRVTVTIAGSAASAQVTVSGAGLPAGHAALLELYNLASFRHPVFGNKTNWQSERGNPYFYQPIEKVIGESMERNMMLSLEDAIAAIGGRL